MLCACVWCASQEKVRNVHVRALLVVPGNISGRCESMFQSSPLSLLCSNPPDPYIPPRCNCVKWTSEERDEQLAKILRRHEKEESADERDKKKSRRDRAKRKKERTLKYAAESSREWASHIGVCTKNVFVLQGLMYSHDEAERKEAEEFEVMARSEMKRDVLARKIQTMEGLNLLATKGLAKKAMAKEDLKITIKKRTAAVVALKVAQKAAQKALDTGVAQERGEKSVRGQEDEIKECVDKIEELRGHLRRKNHEWQSAAAEDMDAKIIKQKRREVVEVNRWEAFADKVRRPWDERFEAWKAKQQGAADSSDSDNASNDGSDDGGFLLESDDGGGDESMSD